MNTKTIAIIGCGAAAVSFVRKLLNLVVEQKLTNIKIIIFEPHPNVGVGLAYQADLTNLIINRPIQTMSAHETALDEFHIWLQGKPEWVTKKLHTNNEENHPNAYISREIFGYYLQDTLQTAITKALANKIHVEIIQEYVQDVFEEASFKIHTNKQILDANYVIFCTGNNKPNDVFFLQDTPQYINEPYPAHKQLTTIPKQHSVGIIGNSLTAIDIAISLKNLLHEGNICMMSRMHVYPRVRGIIPEYSLRYLTKQAIDNIIKTKSLVSLNDILRLFRKELNTLGFDWRPLFREHDKTLSFADALTEELNASQQERKWQALLAKTNEIIEVYWDALDVESKNRFLRHFHRIWLNNRSPIPQVNAYILLEMCNKQQLNVISGLKEISYDFQNKTYIANYTNNSVTYFDWIINATGPSKYVTQSDILMSNLIKKGMMREHPFGGIDVDFATAAPINVENKINKKLRLLGHNTTGVYYYTSSLEMIAKRADVIAHDLVKLIVEEKMCD